MCLTVGTSSLRVQEVDSHVCDRKHVQMTSGSVTMSYNHCRDIFSTRKKQMQIPFRSLWGASASVKDVVEESPFFGGAPSFSRQLCKERAPSPLATSLKQDPLRKMNVRPARHRSKNKTALSGRKEAE